MRLLLCRLLAMFVSFALIVYAQEPLTNESIIKMTKAGLTEDVIVSMIAQQPGKYLLTPDDVIALKNSGVSDKVIAALVNKNSAPPPGSPMATAPTSPMPAEPLILHDGTPLRLRLTRNLSSADSKTGDTVDFEVIEELKLEDIVLVTRGGIAIATVTEAQPKRRMGRGGKLNVNIDYVRLVNGDKIALRAVKETKGGGHTGAMTGGIVASAIVFFPAAPFFLFMHGKDITIPKGTEITAYVSGEIKLDREKLKPAK
jgi:hypothetical protein